MTTLAMPARNVRAIRSALAATLAGLVVGCGHVVGYVRRVLPTVPGLAGAALASWGAAQVFTPAGWILGGLFLLAADRQVTLRGRG